MLAAVRRGEGETDPAARRNYVVHEHTADNKVRLLPNRFSQNSTVAAFLLEVHASLIMSSLRVQAVTCEGESLEGLWLLPAHNVALFEFECTPEEIESFRIEVLPNLALVRIPIPDLKGFPEANRGLTDLLDMQIPLVEIGSQNDVYAFLNNTLSARTTKGIIASPADSAPRVWRDFTVREFLDHYYPGRWRVKDGKVNAGGSGSNTVLGKVMRALGV
jgi:hypothetical protein